MHPKMNSSERVPSDGNLLASYSEAKPGFFQPGFLEISGVCHRFVRPYSSHVHLGFRGRRSFILNKESMNQGE